MATKEYILPSDTHYVLDGGSLIHRIPWDIGETWEAIYSHFTSYIAKKFGLATIVFDGYNDGPTTKYGVHARRAKGDVGPTVQFTSDMVCTVRKDKFLSNNANKQRFIHMLGTKLEQQGCDVLHARADADVLIAQTAVTLANQHDTVLVGDDTDLLVLLCSLSRDVCYKLYFRPETRQQAKKETRFWYIKWLQRP